MCLFNIKFINSYTWLLYDDEKSIINIGILAQDTFAPR